MKQFLSLLLCLNLLLPYVAHATAGDLNTAYEDLTYSLQVEWDQRSEQDYQRITNIFADRLAELKEQGLTNEELVAFSVSKLNDQRIAEDIQKVLAMVSVNELSSDEAQDLVESILSKTQKAGASWSGGATVFTIGTILLIAVVVDLVAGNPIGGIIVGPHGPPPRK